MGISGSADSVLNLIADGKRFDGKAMLEYTPRDAKGGEMKLVFNERFCEWEIETANPDALLNDCVIRWILDHTPAESFSIMTPLSVVHITDPQKSRGMQ